MNRLIIGAAADQLVGYEKVVTDTDRNFWIGAEEAIGYGLISKIVSSADEV